MLQYHSHYDSSVLDGMCSIPKTIKRAKELGYTSLGITDHGTGQGIFRFYKECIKEGIKPILGVEAYLGELNETTRSHIIIIAKNYEGLQSIYKMITYSYMKNFHGKPRVTMEELLKYKDNIIITTACLGGKLAKHFFKNEVDKAKEYVEFMNSNFDFYVEMQPNKMIEQVNYNKWLLNTFGSSVKYVVNSDMHYVLKDDYEVHDTLLAMQVKKKKNDNNRFKFNGRDYFMMSHSEIKENMNYIDSSIIDVMLHNTECIADKCNVVITTGNNYLPHVDNAEKRLAEACNVGFIERLKDDKFNGLNIQKVIQRIKYELKVICDKGYATYFLIVQDYINYAKNNNIPTGAGRGYRLATLQSNL